MVFGFLGALAGIAIKGLATLAVTFAGNVARVVMQRATEFLDQKKAELVARIAQEVANLKATAAQKVVAFTGRMKALNLPDHHVKKLIALVASQY